MDDPYSKILKLFKFIKQESEYELPAPAARV